MNVKCPKCRFRFDVPASPGMKELQCNCPRCGIPFTYVVEENPTKDHLQNHRSSEGSYRNANANDPHGQNGGSSYSNTSSSPHQSAMGSGQARTTLNNSSRAQHSSPFQTARDTSKISFTENSNTPQRKKHGCLRSTLLLLAAVILTYVLLIRQCESSESYSTDNVNIGISTDSNIEDNSMPIPTPSYDEDAVGEKAPAWIQGNWHVETDYGGISLKIHGKMIAETSGGETSYGKYRYQNHHLYCDFGDNNVFVYRLVEATHQIDAGNGILMEKVN
jgi:phage FluMu protein Com